MKGIDKKTKEMMDMLVNIDTFDLVSSPSFGFTMDTWIDPRKIEISLRKEKINIMLRKKKIKYIIKNYGK